MPDVFLEEEEGDLSLPDVFLEEEEDDFSFPAVFLEEEEDEVVDFFLEVEADGLVDCVLEVEADELRRDTGDGWGDEVLLTTLSRDERRSVLMAEKAECGN
mgnify:CR=1 FL=1